MTRVGLTVFKNAEGQWRWALLSSNAFEDRDGEVISQKALEEDVARADADGDYGPLRWWHVPGLDIGTCDFNAMEGRILVEAGSFVNEQLGESIAAKAIDLSGSIGFFHPDTEPDEEGVYHSIRRFERSLLPKEAASNPFVQLVVEQEGTPMKKEKIEEFKKKLGLGADGKLVESVVEMAEKAEATAIDQGVRTKEAEALPEVTPEVAPASEAEPVVEPAAEVEPSAKETSEVTEAVSTETPAEVPAEPPAEPVAETVKADVPAPAVAPEDQPISGMTMGELVQLITTVVGKLEPVTADVPAGKEIAEKAAQDLAQFKEEVLTSAQSNFAQFIETQKATAAETAKAIETMAGKIEALIGEAPRSVARAARASQEEATLVENQPDDVKQRLADKGGQPTPDSWLDKFVGGITAATGAVGESPLVLGGPGKQGGA